MEARTVNIVDEYKKINCKNEGTTNFLYKDINGYLTIGRGHLVADVETAIHLPLFLRGTETAASAEEIQKEFSNLASLPHGQGYPASFYQSHTTLFLQPKAIEDYETMDIENCLHELKIKFPGFATYPLDAQLAMLDMSYNLGMPKLTKQYPKMCAAIKDQDWLLASKECHRHGIQSSRNEMVKQLFHQAHVSVSNCSSLRPEEIRGNRRFLLRVYAELASHVYRSNNSSLPDQWEIFLESEEIIHFSLSERLLEVFATGDFNPPRSQEIYKAGYVGTAYRHKITGQIIIAHAGTDLFHFKNLTNISNLGSDFILAIFKEIPTAHLAAKDFYQQVKDKWNELYPGQPLIIEHTGHSLGGVHAQLFGIEYPHEQIVTFEAPGVRELLPRERQALIYENVSNYVMENNAINTTNTRVGYSYQLHPCDTDALELRNKKSISWLLKCHALDTCLNAINGYGEPSQSPLYLKLHIKRMMPELTYYGTKITPELLQQFTKFYSYGTNENLSISHYSQEKIDEFAWDGFGWYEFSYEAVPLATLTASPPSILMALPTSTFQPSLTELVSSPTQMTRPVQHMGPLFLNSSNNGLNNRVQQPLDHLSPFSIIVNATHFNETAEFGNPNASSQDLPASVDHVIDRLQARQSDVEAELDSMREKINSLGLSESAGRSFSVGVDIFAQPSSNQPSLLQWDYHSKHGLGYRDPSNSVKSVISMLKTTAKGSVVIFPTLAVSIPVELPVIGIMIAAAVPVTLAGFGIKRLVDYCRLKSLPVDRQAEANLRKKMEAYKLAVNRDYCWENHNPIDIFRSWSTHREKRKEELLHQLEVMKNTHPGNSALHFTCNACRYAIENNVAYALKEWPQNFSMAEDGLKDHLNKVNDLFYKAINSHDYTKANQFANELVRWLPNSPYTQITKGLALELNDPELATRTVNSIYDHISSDTDRTKIDELKFQHLWRLSELSGSLHPDLQPFAIALYKKTPHDARRKQNLISTCLYDFNSHKNYETNAEILIGLEQIEAVLPLSKEQLRTKAYVLYNIGSSLCNASNQTDSDDNEALKMAQDYYSECQQAMSQIGQLTLADKTIRCLAMLKINSSNPQNIIHDELIHLFNEYKNKQNNDPLNEVERQLAVSVTSALIRLEQANSHIESLIDYFENSIKFGNQTPQLLSNLAISYYLYVTNNRNKKLLSQEIKNRFYQKIASICEQLPTENQGEPVNGLLYNLARLQSGNADELESIKNLEYLLSSLKNTAHVSLPLDEVYQYFACEAAMALSANAFQKKDYDTAIVHLLLPDELQLKDTYAANMQLQLASTHLAIANQYQNEANDFVKTANDEQRLSQLKKITDNAIRHAELCSVTCYKILNQDKENYQALLLSGYAAIVRGGVIPTSSAKRAFDKIIDKLSITEDLSESEKNILVEAYLGRSHIECMGEVNTKNFKNAISDCEHAQRINPHKENLSDHLLTLKYNLARLYESKGKFDKAQEYYQQCHRAKTNNLDYLMDSARALCRGQRITEAKARLREAKTSFPDNETLQEGIDQIECYESVNLMYMAIDGGLQLMHTVAKHYVADEHFQEKHPHQAQIIMMLCNLYEVLGEIVLTHLHQFANDQLSTNLGNSYEMPTHAQHLSQMLKSRFLINGTDSLEEIFTKIFTIAQTSSMLVNILKRYGMFTEGYYGKSVGDLAGPLSGGLTIGNELYDVGSKIYGYEEIIRSGSQLLFAFDLSALALRIAGGYGTAYFSRQRTNRQQPFDSKLAFAVQDLASFLTSVGVTYKAGNSIYIKYLLKQYPGLMPAIKALLAKIPAAIALLWSAGKLGKIIIIGGAIGIACVTGYVSYYYIYPWLTRRWENALIRAQKSYARQALKENKLDVAIAAYQKILMLRPEDNDVRSELERIERYQDLAHGHYERVIERCNQVLSVKFDSEVATMRAQVLLRQGKLSLAEHEFKCILQHVEPGTEEYGWVASIAYYSANFFNQLSVCLKYCDSQLDKNMILKFLSMQLPILRDHLSGLLNFVSTNLDNMEILFKALERSYVQIHHNYALAHSHITALQGMNEIYHRRGNLAAARKYAEMTYDNLQNMLNDVNKQLKQADENRWKFWGSVEVLRKFVKEQEKVLNFIPLLDDSNFIWTIQFEECTNMKDSIEKDSELAKQEIENKKQEIDVNWRNVSVETTQLLLDAGMQVFSQLMIAACLPAPTLSGTPLPEVGRVKLATPDSKRVNCRQLFQQTHSSSSLGKSMKPSCNSNEITHTFARPRKSTTNPHQFFSPRKHSKTQSTHVNCALTL